MSVGELLELALAEHGRGGERVAPLRDGRDDVVAERVHEAPELGEVGVVVVVGDAGQLNGDQDRLFSRLLRLVGTLRHRPSW